jgi:hypothetical protein
MGRFGKKVEPIDQEVERQSWSKVEQLPTAWPHNYLQGLFSIGQQPLPNWSSIKSKRIRPALFLNLYLWEVPRGLG